MHRSNHAHAKERCLLPFVPTSWERVTSAWVLYSARDMYVVIVIIIVVESTPTQPFRTYGLGSDASSRAVRKQKRAEHGSNEPRKARKKRKTFPLIS